MKAKTKQTLKADKKAAFIAALARGSSVTAAARRANVGRPTVYEWREQDEEFALAWEDALEQGIDRLEDAALERALGMATEDGKIIFSDKLLEMLLKAKRPERYRERYDVNHKHDGQTKIVLDFRVVERGPDGELRVVEDE